jgi:MtN3 and saliva related transmembrane protein
MMIDIIKWTFGLIASITGIVGFIPQIIKAYKTKSTNDISMGMLINYLICCITWAGYGLIENTFFVIWSNIVGTGVCLIVILQKIYYDKYKKS